MRTWLKWTLGVAGGLVLLAVVFGGGSEPDDGGGASEAGGDDGATPATGATTTTPAGTTTTTTPPSAPAGRAPPPAISFEGSGKRATDEFSTEDGLLRVTMRHDGSSNFIVWLLDAGTGEQEALLVNEIGAYDAARYVSVPPGRYVMDVTADGAWSVTVAQPRPTDGRAPPTSDAGDRDAAPEPLRLSRGLHRFAMTHQGEGNFIVWLLDAQGRQVDLLANEIGPWEGEAAIGVPRDGVYVMDVVADGPWTIAVAS
ncbi:MAG TPA: hypothetical protein VNX21_07955 [Candidatus Thermoplasmatota archaeon]|nr:hypothetical protein [Candidatus Thermoplasmatota archaeon]